MMDPHPHGHASAIASLQALINSARSSLDSTRFPKPVCFYEDDCFAFEIDENGHEVGRVKGSDRLREALEAGERQRLEIQGLSAAKKELEQKVIALNDELTKIEAARRKDSEKEKKMEVAFSNLKNKFTALMEYVKTKELYEAFRQEVEQEARRPASEEITYKIIEIPVEREVIV
jgi:hypothetical protein